MISDILKEGIRQGFSSVEVSQTETVSGEYTRENGVTAVHRSDLKETCGRVMKETGDPLLFLLSGTDKRSASGAFRCLGRQPVSGGEKNFRKLLPRSADKVRLEIYDPSFGDRGEEDLNELWEKIRETALDFPGLKIHRVRFMKTRKKYRLMNSRGFHAKYRKTLFSVTLRLSLNGGSLDLNENRILFRDLEPFRLVSRGYTLLESLTDRPPELSRYTDLVFSPEAAALLLRVFSRHFLPTEAAGTARVTYPGVLNIADEPGLDLGAGSVPFDDEGMQRRVTPIIRKGVFMSPVNDLRSAHSTGVKPTGNGFRRGPGHYAPGFTNLYIRPSLTGVGTILGDVSDALLVSLIRPVSSSGGDHLFSVYGYRYREGQRGEAVHFFMRTTFHDFFLSIERVSREIRFFYSGFNAGSPYLLTKGKKTGDNILRI